MLRRRFVLLITLTSLMFASRVSAQTYPEGMIGYWKFDEGSGTIAYDSVGDNHGILLNGSSWTTGQVGGALSFDGIDDYVDCGDSSNLYLNSFTVMAWVKSNTEIGQDRWRHKYIVHKKYNYELSWAHSTDPDYDKAIIFQSQNNVWNKAQIASPLNSAVWYFITGTYDGTELKIYLNGNLENGAVVSENTRMSQNPLVIGAVTPVEGHFFNGLIDEVAIYDRALSISEIQEHYQNTLSGRGYEKRDDDNDDHAVDVDCNDNDSSIYPGAPELCDSKDNDCNNEIPANETDADNDAFMICQGDCNDADAEISPESYELPGNVTDENCDGSLGACDPNAYWKNHGQFVRCVAHETDALIDQGVITEDEGDALISSAAQSNVGKK